MAVGLLILAHARRLHSSGAYCWRWAARQWVIFHRSGALVVAMGMPRQCSSGAPGQCLLAIPLGQPWSFRNCLARPSRGHIAGIWLFWSALPPEFSWRDHRVGVLVPKPGRGRSDQISTK